MTAWEQALAVKWQDRLRRLVAADPQFVDELRVVVELCSMLATLIPRRAPRPPFRTTFGNNRVNQAGRGLHVTIGE